MTPLRTGILSLCFLIVAGCDPAAFSVLVLRPTSAAATSAQHTKSPPVLDTISSILEDLGFEKRSYQSLPGSEKFLEKITTECGHSNYWVKATRDSIGSFGSSVRVCISSGQVRVTLSDFGRFSLSEPTKALREKLMQAFSEKLPSMEVTVE